MPGDAPLVAGHSNTLFLSLAGPNANDGPWCKKLIQPLGIANNSRRDRLECGSDIIPTDVPNHLPPAAINSHRMRAEQFRLARHVREPPDARSPAPIRRRLSAETDRVAIRFTRAGAAAGERRVPRR
jgi:hypothetical protein